MRIFTLALLLTLSLNWGFTQTNHQVETEGLTFVPAQLTIEVGDTVTWTNTSLGFHNVNGSLGSYPDNPEGFENGAAASGLWTFQHVFSLPGTYTYQCDPHATQNMIGFITVNDNTMGGIPDVVITEIMYNPPESGTDSLEFIELYNNGDSDVNLLGYTFTEGVVFTFTSGYNLGVGEYVMIASDSVAFENNFGLPAFQFVEGSLSNGGEDIELQDGNGNVVDYVDYDDSFPWPAEPDAGGASLVLCDFDGDNSLAENWSAANTSTGLIINGLEVFANPGAASACPDGPIVRFLALDAEVSEAEAPFQLGVEISNAGDAEYTVDVSVLASSTATVGADVDFSPTTLVFASGEAVDTMYIGFTLTDDADVEMLEVLNLQLTNPSNDLTVDGPNGTFSLTITDNDADIADIVITEIMYNPPGADDMYEYLELYNNGDAAVNMDGYYFSEGIVDTLDAVTLQPGDYLLLAVDSASIELEFGVAAFQWESGALTNGGEDIELRDPLGNVVDFVEYDDGGDWPEEADGGGSALVLCDPSADNNDPASWIAGVQESGVFLSGTQVLGSPGTVNDCTPPEPMGYTPYAIGDITGNDAEGVPDSIGVRVELTAVVYGNNLRPGGLQFTLIDENNDGVATFSNSEDYGYTVAEGDEVTVQGTVSQFSGLTQINLDTVIFNSAGNMLFAPTSVDAFTEDTESQLIVIAGVTIVDMVTAGGGLNVTVEDGEGAQHLVRVDFDSGITEEDVMGFSGSPLQITGIGSQFDSSSPYDEGYQLIPRYLEDIEIIFSTDEPSWAADVILSPVPVRDILRLNLPLEADQISVFNAMGQLVLTTNEQNSRLELDASQWPAGMYSVRIVSGTEQVNRKIVKQ